MMKKIIQYWTAVVLATGAAFCAHAAPAPAASVTTNGVTTFYTTLTNAWTVACEIQKTGANVTVTLLREANVETKLETGSNGALTLDLNDHVLAYTGTNDSIIQQNGGTLHVVDTATTRTPHYFTCDETGLWTLTNEVTELVVKGGLLTGARNSAIYYFTNVGTIHSISNVNFVGNYSTYNGGAVTTFSASFEHVIADCVFLGNVAANNGGAVSVGKCTMTDCRVEKNVATEKGGGVYVRDHGTLVRTEVVDNKAKTGGGVHVVYDAGGCFPAGVKILMADGSEKAVEEVAEGDVVATFDHVGGVKSSAAVFYVYRGASSQNVFTLSFASGATLEVADRHDLLLEATRKYVTIAFDNARSYVGSRFYNYATGTWDTLTGVTPAKGGGAYYSLYTSGHGNCVANGMITAPDDKDCFINVYELDENLKADAAQLAADIEKYGLATPEDYPNIPLDDFTNGNIRYARIAIGKGLTTQAELLFWNEYDYGPVVVKKAKGALKLTTSSAKNVSPSTPYLQVGEGVVVTGNVSAVGTDNAYLESTKSFFGTVYTPVIDILPAATDLDIGVTLSTGTGTFGWTNDVNYATSFFADNPIYSVSYTVDGVLALRAGIQVGDDAWATVESGVCTIAGTGDMWDMAAAKMTPLWGLAITNIVVANGVTKVGAHVFEKMATVKDVSLAGSVTNVGTLAFHKCYLLTNVVSAASAATTVGDGAFLRCNSLERLHFDGAATFGREAYTLQAGIRMVGDQPEVYPIPQIECGSYAQRLKGSNDLQTWHDIKEESEKLDYRFFKLVMEPVKQ